MNSLSQAASDVNDADARAVLDSIRRIVQLLRLASRDAEKRVGLSGAQLFVLHKLESGGALSLNELARRTLTHQSSVSVVVQKLVNRGLVSRAKGRTDARQIELALTPAARAKLRKAPIATQEHLLSALQKLPAKDRKQLARLLARLVTLTGLPGTDQAAPMLFEDGPQLRKGKVRRNGGA